MSGQSVNDLTLVVLEMAVGASVRLPNKRSLAVAARLEPAKLGDRPNGTVFDNGMEPFDGAETQPRAAPFKEQATKVARRRDCAHALPFLP